jgi:F420-dependent oxidoreductase-like protein
MPADPGGRDDGPVRLSLNLGHLVGAGDPAGRVRLATEAERLGFHTVWAAEVYGSDAVTMLTWVAAHTRTIGVGSAVMQTPGRSPALTAMTAATLDRLSGGRFRLGLGVSGPQVSEGWHGVPFAEPIGRTREYVDVVRLALSRRPVAYPGRHHPLPLPGGAGKALRMTLHPPRPDLPVYLAAVGPRNLRLAGEIADGWLAAFLTPEYAGEQIRHLRAGRERAGRSMAGFEVIASVPLAVGDDVGRCADRVRAHTALYLGGMGSRDHNFYNALAARMGYADAARTVQDLYLAKRYAEAAAAVPAEFVDRTSLLGPVGRIGERLREYAAAGVTELAVTVFGGGARALRDVREAYEAAVAAPAGSVRA